MFIWNKFCFNHNSQWTRTEINKLVYTLSSCSSVSSSLSLIDVTSRQSGFDSICSHEQTTFMYVIIVMISQ